MELSQKPILGFQKEYRWLSNFWHAPITVIGFPYQNTEAAYQASKTLDLDARKKFELLSGAQAKQLGRKLKIRPDWDLVKFEMMELVLRAKFMTHGHLAAKLRNTTDRPIIELNTWGDTIWGQVKNKNGVLVGDNMLGKLLMNIRDDIQ